MDQLTLVEQAYWDLAFAARNLDVQNDALGQARAQVESNERQVTQGTLAPIDVVEAQTQVSRFRADRRLGPAGADVGGEPAEAADARRTGRRRPGISRSCRPISPSARRRRIVLDEAVKLALAGGPSSRRSTSRARRTRSTSAFFKNQTKPQLNVVGGYTLSGLAGDPLDSTSRAAGRQRQRRHRALRAAERAVAPRQPRPARPAHVVGTAARARISSSAAWAVAQQPVRAPLSDRARPAADGSAAAQPHGAGQPGALGDRRDAARAPAAAARAGDRRRSARRAAGRALVGAALRGRVVAAPLRARAVPRASAAASIPG